MNSKILFQTLPLVCRNLKNFEKSNFKISKSYFSTAQLRLSELLFSKKHEWVKVDGNIGTVGVSSYAQESLGDVVYVLCPDVGTDLDKNEEAGTIESVKAASEIYSPVSGKVTEINEQLESKPGLVNKSCYKDGWIYKLELKDEQETKELMNETEYNNYLKTVAE